MLSKKYSLRSMHPNVHGSMIYNSQDIYMYTHTHTHTHTHTMECYSAIKKNEIMPFAATWIDLGIIILSEVSQTEKAKCHRISLICGI